MIMASTVFAAIAATMSLTFMRTSCQSSFFSPAFGAIWSMNTCEIDEPVWLATFLPFSPAMLPMPSSLRAMTRVVLPTSSICAMATSWPRECPMRKEGPA
ncbi:hypothetical protein D3C83_06450 [compost metagenome]